MKQVEFAALLDKIQEQERAVRKAGQAEYAREEDNCFANFDRIGKQMELSREKVLWVYFAKHLDGISAHLNGHTSQREDVRGRIKDARMYLALLWGMLEDGKKQAEAQPSEIDGGTFYSTLRVRSQGHVPHPDGWEYGADPLDELSRRRDMPEPLQGPRYSDIVSCPDRGLDL